ncbi:MAG: phosphatase PAP2 family protein [Cryobacterium sp.]|nr:phosphatase PAP2 family protein [Oligoflexia bacterium]
MNFRNRPLHSGCGHKRLSHSRLLIALSLSWLISACSTLPSTATTSTESAGPVTAKPLPPWALPYYLRELPFPASEIIGPPPEAGSEVDRDDLKTLLEVQSRRTAAQCEAARLQEMPSLDGFFNRSMVGLKGLPDFSKLEPATARALQDFFSHAQHDVIFMGMLSKRSFERKRPYERDAAIKPCVKRETSSSFPSAHAGYAAAGALILGELFPQNAVALASAAQQVGLNRVLGGVHHPSDVEAGKRVGRAAYAILSTNLRFLGDLSEVKRLLAADKNLRAKKIFAPGKVLERAGAAASAAGAGG